MNKIVEIIREEFKDGVSGATIEIVQEDDTGNSEGAVKAVQKLVEVDKVDALVGPFFTNQILAVKEYLAEKQIPTILATSGNPGIFSAGSYVFSIEQTTIVNMSKHSEYMQYRGITKAALFAAYTDASVMQMQLFEEVWPNEIVYNDTYVAGIDDFRTMLTKLKAAAPEAIWIHTSSEDFRKVLRQMIELGFDFDDILLECDSECIQAGVLEEFSEYVDGHLVYSDNDVFVDPRSEELYNSFMSAYTAKYGSEPDLTFVKMYDCFKIMLDCYAAAGEGGAALRAELASLTDWCGATGFVSLNDEGYSDRANAIYEYVDGKANRWSN